MGDPFTWWNPLAWIRLWRYRRTPEYKLAMAGYRTGAVCRFCDTAYASRDDCPTQYRYCDFRRDK